MVNHVWRIVIVCGKKLRNLKSTSNLPWLVMGDFNEALWQEEQISSTPRLINQMEAVMDVLYD
jgi:hypothetical protein